MAVAVAGAGAMAVAVAGAMAMAMAGAVAGAVAMAVAGAGTRWFHDKTKNKTITRSETCGEVCVDSKGTPVV